MAMTITRSISVIAGIAASGWSSRSSVRAGARSADEAGIKSAIAAGSVGERFIQQQWMSGSWKGGTRDAQALQHPTAEGASSRHRPWAFEADAIQFRHNPPSGPVPLFRPRNRP
ncbi:MAG: hypothetical protein IPK52_13475 [Chloroflexi bacterium]|nr:hypothetical protein [Chloroflexota bacterium]